MPSSSCAFLYSCIFLIGFFRTFSSSLSDGTGLLLLCEVAAKPFFEQHNANYNADRDSRAASCLATKGLGRVQPAAWQDAGETLENDALKGVHMPKGKPKEDATSAFSLWYNEVRLLAFPFPAGSTVLMSFVLDQYIVYDPAQIRVRYLLMVKM